MHLNMKLTYLIILHTLIYLYIKKIKFNLFILSIYYFSYSDLSPINPLNVNFYSQIKKLNFKV